MSIEDVRKLLGGYATGTLTEEEQKALFQAALNDQALFDALADEQALKELLQDPVCRGQLLASLEQGRPPAWARLGAWLRRPSALALAGAMAAIVVIVGVVRQNQIVPPPAAPKLVTPAPPVAATPQARPAERHARALKPPAVVARKAAGAPAPASLPQSAAIVAQSPPPQLKSVTEAAPTARELYFAAEAPPASGLRQREVAGGAVGGVPSNVRMAPTRMAALGAPGVRYSILQQGKAVDPHTIFHPGDALEVRLEPNEDGYLSVLSLDASDQWKPVFQNRVQARGTYTVPLRLEDRPAERKLRVVFSRQPQAALVNTLADAPTPRVLVEKAGPATYVAGQPGPPDTRLTFEITLTAQ